MRKPTTPRFLQNEKGILTLDFIFAILMMFAFSAILFGFTITFSAVEIAQYATFASSRAYYAGNKNIEEQEKLGKEKFNQLIRSQDSILGAFFRNGWFELGDVKIGDFNSEYGTDPGKDSDTFIGAKATFTAKILNMRFPLLGSTTDDDLTATINSFLGRAPTEEECMDFVNQRFDRIQKLKPGFETSFVQPTAYAKIADDGC